MLLIPVVAMVFPVVMIAPVVRVSIHQGKRIWKLREFSVKVVG